MAKKIPLFAFILICFSSVCIAQESTSILLKVEGIEGESMVDGHEKEIDLLTWEWGASQTGSMQVGGGGGAGKPKVQDIIITKYVDKASPDLLLACLNGSHLGEAILSVKKAGLLFDSIVITISPVLVTSVMSAGNQDYGRPIERVTLNFGKVKYSYTPQKPDGFADAAIYFTWNVETNRQE